MKLNRILYIILIFAVIVLCLSLKELSLGSTFSYTNDNFQDKVTKQQVLEMMYESRYSHQVYLDHPELMDRSSELGNKEHHLMCIEKYDKVIHYIKGAD